MDYLCWNLVIHTVYWTLWTALHPTISSRKRDILYTALKLSINFRQSCRCRMVLDRRPILLGTYLFLLWCDTCLLCPDFSFRFYGYAYADRFIHRSFLLSPDSIKTLAPGLL